MNRAVLVGHSAGGLDAPLEVLNCLTRHEATLLKSTFHVLTIRDLVNHKLMRCINALSRLEQEVAMQQTVATESVLDEALAMTFPASDPIAIQTVVSHIKACT